MLKYFKYKYVSVEQVNELVKIEPILKSFIASDKPFSIRIMPDHFQCFVHTIISQQLSNKAVDTI
jgi:3-methyladenine DNA glycosylase/8-oxoguanine DNA glycosylase